MSAATEAGFAPTGWTRWNESLRFSNRLPRRKQALDLPRYRLHPLKGDLKGFWSVTVRANWRIVFRFEGEDAFDVELTDYH
jgi:plasmid maintenance system killer protein